MRHEDIAIPSALARFPKWKGFPIHYTVYTDRVTGEPNFKVMDEERRIHCFKEDLCHLCGWRFRKNQLYWFIGGPKCIEQRAFVDGPMHEVCARYACKVCPFLSSPNGKYASQVPVVDALSGKIVEYKNVENMRPPRMALASAKSYHVGRNTGVVMDNPGGPDNPESHAVNPTGSGQLVCLVRAFDSVEWDAMPSAEVVEPEELVLLVELQQNRG